MIAVEDITAVLLADGEWHQVVDQSFRWLEPDDDGVSWVSFTSDVQHRANFVADVVARESTVIAVRSVARPQ